MLYLKVLLDNNHETSPEEQPYSQHGNSYAALMLGICIGSCGIALSLIPVLSSTTNQTHLKEQIINATYYCEVAYTLFCMIVCICLLVKQKDLIQKGCVQFHNNSSVTVHENTHLVKVHKSRIYIVIFGIGGMLFLSCTAINRALQTQVVSLLLDCALLLCFTVYITMIYRYHGARLENRAIFHYGIAFLIGGNVWSWVLITVYPLYGAYPRNSSAYNINALNEARDTFSAANSVHIFEIMKGLFQPFFIEFLTISLGCLLSLWQTMRYGPRSMMGRSVRKPPSAEEFIDRDYNDILHVENVEAQLDPEQQSTSKKCKICIFTTFSVLVAGPYLIVLQILSEGPFGICTEHLKNSTCALYRKIIGICVYSPLLIMNVISLFKLYRNKTNIIPFESQLTSSGYLLLTTSSAYFIYGTWRLAADIGLLNFPVEQDLYEALYSYCILLQ